MLIKLISKAINVPLMDVKNISFLIADYLMHSIFYLQHEVKIPIESPAELYTIVTTNACILATSKEHAWELYLEHVKNNDIEKEDFFNSLGDYSYGTYLTTKGSIKHLKIDSYDERDEFYHVEYEYKNN